MFWGRQQRGSHLSFFGATHGSASCVAAPAGCVFVPGGGTDAFSEYVLPF